MHYYYPRSSKAHVLMATILLIVLNLCALCNAKNYQINNNYRSDYDNTGYSNSTITKSNDDGSFLLPLELAQKLNEVTDINDFVNHFIDKTSLDAEMANANKFNRDGNFEKSAAVRATPALCQPALTVVELKPQESNNPAFVYFPSCTRVKRCGGCCSHKLLKCQPTDSRDLVLQVLKSEYVGGGRLQYRSKENIMVEEHTACRCGCALQEKDCNSLQVYDRSQCSCVCTNIEDQAKCLKDELKLWEPSACLCKCREIKECTTGSHFDLNRCICRQTPTLAYTEYPRTTAERKSFILKPTLVKPMDDEKYDTYDVAT